MTGSISYSALAALTVYLGTGGDNFTIGNTAAGTNTTVDAGPGNDAVNVQGTGGPTTVIGGTGANTFYVSSTSNAGVLSKIAGALTLLGSGTTGLIADDRGENAGNRER